MMGFSHATTGVLVGVAVAAPLAAAAGTPPTPMGLLAWALLGAGSALVPDLDHPSSTATRSQGFVTGLLSRGMRALSLAVYRRTRTPADRSDGEHRHLGHTPVFAAAVGAVIGLLCHLSWWGPSSPHGSLAFLGLRALRKVAWRGLRTALGSWPGAALGALCVAALLPDRVGQPPARVDRRRRRRPRHDRPLPRRRAHLLGSSPRLAVHRQRPPLGHARRAPVDAVSYRNLAGMGGGGRVPHRIARRRLRARRLTVLRPAAAHVRTVPAGGAPGQPAKAASAAWRGQRRAAAAR